MCCSEKHDKISDSTDLFCLELQSRLYSVSINGRHRQKCSRALSVPPFLPPFAPVCNFRRVLKFTNTNAEEEISHESALALLVSRLTLKLGAGNLVLDYVCGRLQVAPGGSSVGCSGAGVTGDCEWVLGTEATSSWLEEQYILLMAEPFLQPTIFQ